ncbi:MAG: class I SAM-dependent methyltransferase [Solirubrobacteraceae bacterium]
MDAVPPDDRTIEDPPLDERLMDDVPPEEWFEDHYQEWRAKRIDAIRGHYGPSWFTGRTLLEVGCGHADIGAAFAALGAIVTASDARQEHLDEGRRRHPEIAAWQLADLDSEWPFQPDFDLVLHLGVLYHLADPELALRRLLQSGGHIVLETEVSDSSDPYFVHRTVEAGYDQAFNSQGSRPSPALVERVLSEAGRSFSRITDDRCNAAFHRYDWPVRDTGESPDGLRRMWFVEARPAHRIPPSPARTAGVRSLLAVQARLRPLQEALELVDEAAALDDLDQSRALRDRTHPRSCTDEEGLALYDVICANGLRSGFEIATAFGYSTAFMGLALARTRGRLVSMDCYVEEWTESFNYERDELAAAVVEIMERIDAGVYPSGLAFANEQLGALGLEDVVELSIGVSPESVADALGGRRLDVALIDGGHFGDQPTHDFEAVAPFLEPRCAVFFHDNNDNEAVQRAIAAAEGVLGSAARVLPTRYRLTLVGRDIDQPSVAALDRLFLRADAGS